MTQGRPCPNLPEWRPAVIQAELRAVTLPLVKLVRSDPKNPAYFPAGGSRVERALYLRCDLRRPGRFRSAQRPAIRASVVRQATGPRHWRCEDHKDEDPRRSGPLERGDARRHLPAQLAEPERQQAPLDTITFKITRASRTVGPLFTSKDPKASSLSALGCSATQSEFSTVLLRHAARCWRARTGSYRLRVRMSRYCHAIATSDMTISRDPTNHLGG